MYDFISTVCRFFIAFLLLGYVALVVAILWGVLGLAIRKRAKKIVDRTLAGTQNIFRLCGDNLKRAEIKSKSAANGKYFSHASPQQKVLN